MKTVEIDGFNIDLYAEYLDYASENIGRDWCRAFLITDEEETTPYAGICWELIGADDDDEVTSQILWCRIWDEQASIALFEEYKQRAKNEGVISTSFELPIEEVRSAKDAFAKAGFSLVEAEGSAISITLSDAMELPFVKKGTLPYYVTNLSDFSERGIKRGIASCLYHGAKGLLYDQATIPTEWFNLDVSSCVETDGKISGLFLLHENPAGALIPQLLFAYGPDFQKDILMMIRCTIQAAGMILPWGTKILLYRHDKRTHALISHLFPNHKGIPVLRGKRAE